MAWVKIRINAPSNTDTMTSLFSHIAAGKDYLL